MRNYGQKAYTYIGGFAALAILIAVIVWSVWLEAHSGTIRFHTEENNVNIYLLKNNDNIKSTVARNGSAKISSIDPGHYTVLAHKEDFLPWTKEVDIEKGVMTKMHPFLIAKNPQYDIVASSQAEYDRIDALISENTSAEKTSREGNITLRKGGGAISAEWVSGSDTLPAYFCNIENVCENPVEVVSILGNIGDFDFYGSREDVVMFAVGQTIYALEIDSKYPQNFQPMYSGESPRFFLEDAHKLYIKDGGVIIALSLK